MTICFAMGLLLISLLLLTSSDARAGPVTIKISGEDGRDFLHPGEKFSISVMDLDSISNVTITGPDGNGPSTTGLSDLISPESWVTNEGTVVLTKLPSPGIEGTYRLEITGLQDGSEKRGTASFKVESFHVRLYPDSSEVYSTFLARGRTNLNVELRDWKGDLIDGTLDISISVMPLISNDTNGSEGEPDEQEWGTSQMTIRDGIGSWIIPFPTVNGSTLFRFRASLKEPGFADPNEVVAECGVVVHPVPLHLGGERVVLEGGGAIINGPFYQRENVNVEIWSWGNITSVVLTDLLTEEQAEFTRTETGMLFVPEKASIYELRVDTVGVHSGFPGSETSGTIQATATMLIIVNDWPIEVSPTYWKAPGIDIPIQIRRDGGAFSAVRGLLLDPQAIPARAITEIISTGNTASSLYEKSLLDSDGNGELRFLTDVNTPDGEYLAIIGVGSWEDGVLFHGLEFVTVNIHDFGIYFTSFWGLGHPVHVSFGGLPYPGENGLQGSVITEFGSFPVKSDGCIMNFSEPGQHLCILTTTGRDVTPFTVEINEHPILIQVPDEIRTGDEVTIRFTDINGNPIVSEEISFYLGWVGTNHGRWQILEPGSTNYTFRAGSNQQYVMIRAPGYIFETAPINIITEPDNNGDEPDGGILRSKTLIFLSSLVLILFVPLIIIIRKEERRKD
jgi:hypothetical protein